MGKYATERIVVYKKQMARNKARGAVIDVIGALKEAGAHIT